MKIRKVWPVLLAVVMVLGFAVLACSSDDPIVPPPPPPPSAPTVVWQPNITATTPLTDSGKAIGNFGIQAVDKPNTTLTVVAGGFTITSTSGQYKSVNVQFENAGGTNYYTTPDGASGVTNGKDYTITFMASVAGPADGGIRLAANNSSTWSSPTTLNTTPKLISYSWTQTGGNLKIDTAGTPQDMALTITGIKITTP